ncbi:hypothetical protein BO70DRAFT_369251 [Aspergillus heteromorphus CBS 117.55]|uniref:RanBD1 domain-containing protein n=1 Tax=Aspergillus heteromorphus CBS 117.55 TaxID=1448321 RepID=A0A317WRK4_9EURO|nr:uncharacterized protein BO70DRAFT_369251 [Aspergillus heteromorphus CBS 117.55]PWY88361.1 hypothetical protein BO70DRAFT_369251 [Aspergillus heteromorphus CBS 117.55]
MASTPEDKPQRATAAQLANRKIKDVRRRPRPNSAAPSAPAPSFGGPFSSIDPNTVSSTPSMSQPFPGASSTPSQSTQNGTSSPFAFGSGGAGGSSNPFANMNNGNSGQSDAGSFSGFKGSMFNAPPASPAPAQQSLPSAPLTGGLFGTSMSNGPSAPSAAATPTAGGLFGQSNAVNTPSTNVFGQPTFGNDSMQTSPDAKAAAAPPSKPTSFFVFDFKAATPTPSLFGTTPQASSAATPAAPTPAPAAATTATPSLFGTASPAKPSTPFQNPFQSTNLFQTTPSTAQKPVEEKKEESKPFTSSTNTGPSLFSKAPSTATTAEPEKPKVAEASANPFGGLQTSAEQQPDPSSTPFQGLFSKPSTAHDAAKPSEPAKPATPGPFSFTPSAATPSASSLFTPKPPASTSAPEPKAQAPFAPSAPAESPFKVNGAKPVSSVPAIGNAPKSTKKTEAIGDSEALYRLRILNECFQRQVSKLDPASDNFDAAVQFYTRVRATLGASVGSKRKATDDGSNGIPPKRAQTFGKSADKTTLPQVISTPVATAPSSTPFKGFGTAQPTSTPTKRKSIDEGDDVSPAKRSFSKSKTTESDDEPVNAAPSPSLFSATPSTAPAKPLFSFSSSVNKDSSPAPLFSSSVSGTSSTSAAPVAPPPANPFVLKAPGTDSSASPAPGPPKFASAGGTDFLAQFKAQSAKDAEKEKQKRKDEDWDSEEEDEAEWERRDAEEQRKKQEQYGAKPKQQAKFIPGKGFVFEESSDSPAKTPEETPTPPVSTGASVFASQNNSAVKSTNIFGHLSATPSEAEDDDNEADDTEEASGGEGDDSPDSSAETKTADSKAASSDDVKGSGRSLFDRVSYDDDGKPKRQGEEEQKGSMSTLFSSSNKFSSFNSTPASLTPGSSSDSIQATSKSTTSNIFGSANAGTSVFASNASSANSTPSIFNTTNSAGDNTWKPNSPIRFATESASASKPDSGAATPVPEAPKPFSNLFGAPPTLTKSDAKSTTPSLGFSFGAPAQANSSLLAPPTLNSAAASRSPTPGVTSDTGAEDSGDGEGENLPQVDLARGGAGEENEDLVVESRARAMKHTAGGGWESQGVGFLRILKDKTTSRGRILVRADPSGNVILNARLMKEIKYSVAKNSVQFMVPQAEGPPQLWALRVKTSTDAERLSTSMEETKS